MEEHTTFTLGEGYRAMFKFIDAYWERRGRVDDQVAVMLGSMQFGEELGPTKPLDPAQWGDWIEAVKAIRS